MSAESRHPSIAMQPGSRIPQQTDVEADARRLAWRRSSLRSRRAMVGTLCLIALTAGIVGSNLYNRLQNVDINDRSAPFASASSSADTRSWSGDTRIRRSAGTVSGPIIGSTATAATPTAPAPAPVANLPAPRPAAIAPTAAHVVELAAPPPSARLPLTAPEPTSAVVLANAITQTTPHAASAVVPRKRVVGGPRLRLDSALHDADWLSDTPAPGAPSTEH